MSGTDIRYDLKDYRDLFAKLKREQARFEEDPSADNLFNTMVTAWSLADWLLADLREPTAEMSADLLVLTGRPSRKKREISEQDLHPKMRLCRDIADASKHGVLTRAKIVVQLVTATDGNYGGAMYGFTAYGDPRRRYAVEADGQLYDAEDIVDTVVDLYEQFLTKHGPL